MPTTTVVTQGSSGGKAVLGTPTPSMAEEYKVHGPAAAGDRAVRGEGFRLKKWSRSYIHATVGTPHRVSLREGFRFKKWSRSYTPRPAPPTASHCAASNAHARARRGERRRTQTESTQIRRHVHRPKRTARPVTAARPRRVWPQRAPRAAPCSAPLGSVRVALAGSASRRTRSLWPLVPLSLMLESRVSKKINDQQNANELG